MIIGLLILGSVVGCLAFGAGLAFGLPLLTAALLYFGTAFCVVTGIAAANALRPPPRDWPPGPDAAVTAGLPVTDTL